MKGGYKMKRRVNFVLEEEVIQLIRKIAKEECIHQNKLIKDALQCYLILNGQDRKDD